MTGLKVKILNAMLFSSSRKISCHHYSYFFQITIDLNLKPLSKEWVLQRNRTVLEMKQFWRSSKTCSIPNYKVDAQEMNRIFSKEKDVRITQSPKLYIPSTTINTEKDLHSKAIRTRVSVQGVISLGGHFACLCRGLNFMK